MIHATAIAATPLPFLVGSGALYVITLDPNQIGQAILGGIIIAGYVAGRRTTGKKFAKAEDKAQEIHILVNSQKDHLEARIAEQDQQINRQDTRIAQLEKALVASTSPPS